MSIQSKNENKPTLIEEVTSVMMEHALSKLNLSEEKFKRLMDRNYELCREDIVWILNYVKQKAADEDPALLGLHQPRLLKNFHHYAEAAMLLQQARYASSQEYGHIRTLLREACYGLYSD